MMILRNFNQSDCSVVTEQIIYIFLTKCIIYESMIYTPLHWRRFRHATHRKQIFDIHINQWSTTAYSSSSGSATLQGVEVFHLTPSLAAEATVSVFWTSRIPTQTKIKWITLTCTNAVNRSSIDCLQKYLNFLFLSVISLQWFLRCFYTHSNYTRCISAPIILLCYVW